MNFGSSLDRWVLDDGLTLTPLPSSRPQKSAFYELGAQLQYTAPINGNTDWTIGSQLNQRNNPSQHNSDLGSVEVSSGLARTQGSNRYSMSIQLQQLYLDDESFRQAKGLLGQWQRDVDSRTQVGLYGQFFALDFPDQPVRDARRAVIGATVVRGLGDDAKSVVVRQRLCRQGILAPRHRRARLRPLRAQGGAEPQPHRQLARLDRPLLRTSRLRRARQLLRHHPQGSPGRAPPRRRAGTSVPGCRSRRRSSTRAIRPPSAPSDFRRTQALVAARYRF